MARTRSDNLAIGNPAGSASYGAMQRQQHAVERSRRQQPGTEAVGVVDERLVGCRAGSTAVAEHQWQQVDLLALGNRP